MDAAQARGDLTTFDRFHHLYEQISSLVQMPLLLLLALFGALRDTHATDDVTHRLGVSTTQCEPSKW